MPLRLAAARGKLGAAARGGRSNKGIFIENRFGMHRVAKSTVSATTHVEEIGA
eukprot:COSAG02_NODE_41782_length_391_cov_0.654110_1_plen_52_part_10